MILSAVLLALAPTIVVPSAQGLSVEQRVEMLARQESRSRSRIDRAVYDDPAMRAEIRRVGFATGCTAVRDAGKEVIERQAPMLEPRIAEAIAKAIPAQRIIAAQIVSFLANPLGAYHGRVDAELERSAAPALTEARSEMRRAFLARVAHLPSSSNPADNLIKPKPDVAAALGHKGYWSLDNPAQLAFACAEQWISPHLRPHITTGDNG